MNSPHDKPVNIWVKPARKDGKHLVTLCFHQRKLRKLFTPEQIAEYCNDDSYNVTHSNGRPYTAG